MGQIKNIKLHIVTDIKMANNTTSEIFKAPIDLYPDYNVTACLLDNVTNSSDLLQMLIKGDLNCALLNTTYLPEIFPILIASTKAVHCYKCSSLKTKGLHTEVLFNLSPTNSISTSLKTFGIKGDESSVLIVCVRNGDSDIAEIINRVKGDVRDISELRNYVSEEKIKKLYSITDSELQVGTYSDAITLRVATKDAM